MLLIALAPLPYGYYRLLRLVVCVCAGMIAYRLHEDEGATFWMIALAALAVLFNPLILIHLTRETWAVLNVASAALLAVHFVLVRKASKENVGTQTQQGVLK
jgi:hypothetical protein